MRVPASSSLFLGLTLALAAGCAPPSETDDTVDPPSSGGPGYGVGGTGGGGTAGAGGRATAGTGGSGGTPGMGGAGASDGGSSGAGGGPGPGPAAGEACPAPPAPVDVSHPTRVVGTGTPQSCSEAAFTDAVAAGGIITFNCGAQPFTFLLSTEKPVTRDTVIDGGGRITISGAGETRIFAMRGDPAQQTPSLTLQNVTLADGLSEDADTGGAAVYRRGGRLTIINAHLTGNRATKPGLTITGGAITSIGGGETIVSNSTLSGNSASNGGALGSVSSKLVVLNGTFHQNAATGGDASATGAGNGGAISVEGRGAGLVVCDSRIQGNRASANGGGLYRSCDDGGPTIIQRTTFDMNTAIPEGSTGMGGGAYLRGTAASVASSTFSRNGATAGAGVTAAAQGATELAFTNVTVARNQAITGTGGGLSFGAGVKAVLRNVTVVRNEAPGPDGVGAGIALDMAADVTLASSIVTQNVTGNLTAPINCLGKMKNGGGNLQWPVLRQMGGSDDPDALCSDEVLLQDPGLAEDLGDNGGPTQTVAVEAGSPAVGLGRDCPPSDQRGQPRMTAACTAGAFELR